MESFKNLSEDEKLEIVKNAVKSHPDFPVPGVLFQDIFSVLANPPIFALLRELLVNKVKAIEPAIDVVLGLDARGFLFGPIIALDLGIPFAPVRKKGKLPGKVKSFSYSLEYGKDTVEIQEEIIKPNQRVLIVDDLLATGGSLSAACNLVNQIGGTVSKCVVIIELVDLKGREKVPADTLSLIQF